MSRAALIAGAMAAEGWALDSRVSGTTLLETIDARASALGGAATTLTGDISGTSINPALWPTVEDSQLETQFQASAGDVRTGLLAFGQSRGRWGWGVSVVALDAGTVGVAPVGGSPVAVRAQQDVAGALSAGVEVWPWLRIGAAGKALRSRLAEDSSASVMAGDAGMLLDLPLPGLRIGGAVQNVGPELTYRNEGDPLPLFYRAGLSYAWTWGGEEATPVKSLSWYVREEQPLSLFWVGADAVFDRWGKATGHVGAEWEYAKLGTLRLGGIVGEEGVGATGGLGVWIKNWRLDYSIQLVDELTDRHRATVSYFWRTDE